MRITPHEHDGGTNGSQLSQAGRGEDRPILSEPDAASVGGLFQSRMSPVGLKTEVTATGQADGGILAPRANLRSEQVRVWGERMAGGSATTAERNIITVLAVDMVGSTRHIAACDPDEAQAFLDQWLDHIRRSVEHLGGKIVHYAGDGGIAIFGWPTACEDHADRARIAAWDIQGHSESTGPGGYPVNFRVGIHSGLVGLRKGGRNAIYRFDVAGATVHVAAKLQQEASPGEVRVSAETARLCRSPLDVAACKTSSGIGDRLIEVYRLNARPNDIDHNDVTRRYQSPIVGRLDELAAVRERL